MTSTNSSAKFLPMLKNVFKRNIAYVILMALLSTITTTAIIGIIASESRYYSVDEIYDVTQGYSIGLSAVLAGIFAIGSLVIGAVLYREIYNKRSCDFYFAMPVTRGVYFNCNMLFCIITAAVSYAVQALISIICINGIDNCVFDASEFLKRMLMSFLCVLALTAIFMLCAVMAGKLSHYIILSYVAVIVVYWALNGISEYINSIWGMWIDPTFEWTLSPLAGIFHIAKDTLSAKTLICVCAAFVVQFAAAYAAGLSVFKKRKAEVAEFTVAGKILPAAMIAICVFSDFMFSLSTGGEVYLSIIAGLIGAVLSTLILTAFFYKKAFTKETVISLVTASVASLIVVACIELLPNIKYIDYIPEVSEVESVYFEDNIDMDAGNSFGSEMLYVMDGYYDEEYSDDKIFKSDDAKQKIYDLHTKLIDEKTIKNTESYDEYYYYLSDLSAVRITYTLKNGKTVTRAYNVVSSDIFDEYIALMKTEEALNQTEPYNMPDEDILFIGISAYEAYTYSEDYYYDDYQYEDDYDDYYESNSTYIKLDEYGTLFSRIKADRMNESDKMFYSFECPYFYMYNMNQDYTDLQITVYSFSEAATEEDREKVRNMSPAEIIKYENNVIETTDYARWVLDEQYINLNSYADSETAEYLEALGYAVH